MIQRGPDNNDRGLMSLSMLRQIAQELHRADVDEFLRENADKEGWLTVLVTQGEVMLA